MPETRFEFDLLVVGAGPAGIAAAATAAESGMRVALIDQAPTAGGQIWRNPGNASPHYPASLWLQRLHRSGARLFAGTTVFDAPSPRALLAAAGTTQLQFFSPQLVIATGARECFLPFPGWTLPGVMGAGGLQALAKSGWPVASRRVVIAGSGPLLLAAAAQLRKSGARVQSLAEQAPLSRILAFGLSLPWLAPHKCIEALQFLPSLRGVRVRHGAWPLIANGRHALESVTLTNGQHTWTEPCDLLACGFGLVPNLELARLMGCAIRGNCVQVSDTQLTSVPGVFCAGEPTGIGGVDLALVTGQMAGLAAAGRSQDCQALFPARNRARRFARALESAYQLRPEVLQPPPDNTIVCRCEDLTWSALAPFTDWREARLHARCGMGPCQGRTCGDILHSLRGMETSRVRPPLLPVPVAALPRPARSTTQPSTSH